MSSVIIAGDTSGSITLAAPAVSGSSVITLPAATGTFITTTGGVTPGTTGNLLTSNGTSWTSAAAPAAGTPISTPDVKTTGTSATFTIPTGVTKMKVTVIGGGGAGGGSGSDGCGNFENGTGGSAAGAAITYLTGLTPGNTLAYTVGAGGTGSSNANGGSGGTSSVVSGTQTITSITCTGGVGGKVIPNGGGFQSIFTGAGGTATGGTIGIDGGTGGYPNGAPCLFGGAGGIRTSNASLPGVAATGYGSGGGGSIAFNTAGVYNSQLGGAGKAGVVIFEY
tara:strand:- start:533 stop:1372 length:840 start_codon:yes stop_codon:yes gene_type:complete